MSMRKIRHVFGAVVLTAFLVLLTSCTGKQERVRPEETAKKEPDKSSIAQQNLERAKWHASYANPERDYRQALKELELAFDLDPNIGKTDYVRDWLSVLLELDRMTEEYKRMKQRLNQLTKENKDLKESIEKIKNLDIKMEEKRKQIK